MCWFSLESEETSEGPKQPESHWYFSPFGAGDIFPEAPPPFHPWQHSELELFLDATLAGKAGSALCTASSSTAGHL